MTMRVTEETKGLLEAIKESYGFDSLDEAIQYAVEYGSPIRNKLYEWIGEILSCTNGNPSDYVKYVENKESIYAYLYTSSKRYYIVATKNKSYLGCQWSPLSSLPDKGGRGGGDLADGAFCPKTWERIKRDIIGKELKPTPTL